MLLPRVIPCLLVQDGGLVKTVKFNAGKYVGDPINTIKIFNEKRVDELLILDISASRDRREPNYALIEEVASECFMPVCYGGGVRSVAEAKRIVDLGVEKISVSGVCLSRPTIVRDLAAQLGSQSVLACVDVKKSWTGRYRVYDSARGELTDRDPVEHAELLVSMGAGEVLVNNVDRDGTQLGYDNELVRRFTSTLDIPVIACGGARAKEDLRSVVKDAGASAAAAGSMFVFQGPHRAVLISYPAYPEIVRLLGT